MKPVFDENGLAIKPGEIRCFYYDAETSEYTGWSDEYINTGVSMPGYSTDLDPGDEMDGEVAVFIGNGWHRQEDHRGEVVWSISDRSSIEVDYIGAIQDGYTSVAPSTPYDKWSGEKWTTDTVAKYVADISAADMEKKSRIERVNEYINSKQWPGKAALGRLTDTEKSQYNAWLDYLDALEAVDTSSAPAIIWPAQPSQQV